MGNPKCTLPEGEREQVFRWFDGSLTADEEDSLREFFPQYLFFQNAYDDTGLDAELDRSTRHCFCTACREGFPAVRGNWARGKLHNEKCNCPNCGRVVEGKAVTKFKYDMPSLQSWVKTAVARPAPDGGLLIEAGDCRRSFNWDELAGTIDWFPKARYYFRARETRGKAPLSPGDNAGTALPEGASQGSGPIRGLAPTVEGAAMGWKEIIAEYDCRVGAPAHVNWVEMKTISDPFNPNMLIWEPYCGDYAVINIGEALEHSALKYCQLLPFYEYEYAAMLSERSSARWIVKYLGWYTQLPQMEFAVKMGFGEAVRDLVENGKKNAELLNWKAATPAGFLRMDRKTARLFLRAEMTFGDLKAWRATAKGHSFAEYMTLVDLVGGTDNLRRVSQCAGKAGVELGRAARYIARLIPQCRQYAPPTVRIIQTWEGYLDMAKRLHYDMTEPTVVMPRNLQERHDAAAETLQEFSRLDEMKRYKARRRMLEKKYSFALDGYRILVPDSADEIIQEGRTLKHCVGGYAARHISGRTTILFLRKARTPMRSFLTIELYEERGVVKIKQIHGYRNEHYTGGSVTPPAERFAWFLGPWLEWVNVS